MSTDAVQDNWRKIPYEIIDYHVINLEKRFSSEIFNMTVVVNNFSKLNFYESTFFIDHYKVSKKKTLNHL